MRQRVSERERFAVIMSISITAVRHETVTAIVTPIVPPIVTVIAIAVVIATVAATVAATIAAIIAVRLRRAVLAHSVSSVTWGRRLSTF